MAKQQTYKHYTIVPVNGGVDVLDPRRSNQTVLHHALDMDGAKRWVSAYRNGVTWAVLAVQS